MYNTGDSSVGRASDCRMVQISDGPWFDSGSPDSLAHLSDMACCGCAQLVQRPPWCADSPTALEPQYRWSRAPDLEQVAGSVTA